MVEIEWHSPAPGFPLSQIYGVSRPCSIQDTIVGVVKDQWLSLLSCTLRSFASVSSCSSFAPSHATASLIWRESLSLSTLSRSSARSMRRRWTSSSCLLLQAFASTISIAFASWSIRSRCFLRLSRINSNRKLKVFHSDSKTIFHARCYSQSDWGSLIHVRSYHASGKTCKPFDEIPRCLRKTVPTPAESLDHL